ncbi:lysozyme [Parvularcula sp. ZS-1/3]|uniref:Lysozyme n=1 Tax=Parvularcula mediterranea TaxID=2732508 RepID=A0A7Y3W4Z2_9PROT|nr:lysozyme [Parvularcula mediterranea]NNU16265.1 lysozyme [Parvularcula mediterranea]
MDISNRGLNLIKEFEGLELEAYQDIVGVWTIGYGHTSMAGPPEVKPGMEITEAEASEILRRDLGQYENGVERAVKVEITQNMFDALVSLTYNIGVNAMKGSTFIKRINNRDYEGAAEAMKWWNKAGGRVVAGLKRRREAEAALFLEGYSPEDTDILDDQRGAPIEENSPRRGNLGESRTVGGATAAGGAGAVAAGSVFLDNRNDANEESGSEDTAGGETPGDGDASAGDGGTSTDDGDPPNCQEPLEEGEELTDTELAECELAEEETPEVVDVPETETPAEPVSTIEKAEEVFVSAVGSDEALDAIVIAAGVIAIIAAIYIVIARVDDWRNHKR